MRFRTVRERFTFWNRGLSWILIKIAISNLLTRLRSS
jgi:rhamnogalacturonyl hydrolase YesR